MAIVNTADFRSDGSIALPSTCLWNLTTTKLLMNTGLPMEWTHGKCISLAPIQYPTGLLYSPSARVASCSVFCVALCVICRATIELYIHWKHLYQSITTIPRHTLTQHMYIMLHAVLLHICMHLYRIDLHRRNQQEWSTYHCCKEVHLALASSMVAWLPYWPWAPNTRLLSIESSGAEREVQRWIKRGAKFVCMHEVYFCVWVCTCVKRKCV